LVIASTSTFFQKKNHISPSSSTWNFSTSSNPFLAPFSHPQGFYFATHYTSNSPPSLAYQTFHGPNLYPAPTTLPYSTFRDPVQTYHSSLLLLSKRLLDLIAATLPYGPTVFDEFMKEDPLAVLRPLYYPASEAKDGEVVIGAGAHTDFGAITLLLQDEIGGLEVWWDNSLNPVIDGVETTDPEFKGPATGPGGAANMQRKEKGGQWIPVKPNRDALVVNLGDMMQMWTRGRYRSTLHRVVCGGAERSSVPFFLDGWLGCVLRPFGDGDAGKGDGEHRYLTVDEHMRERFGSTYVKTESEEKEG
jgi:isopenicillin N synthase-like dioxygenase